MITGTHGQTIRLSHRCAALNFHREGQIRYHFFYDGQLLIIFFTEHCHFRLYQIKQLGHYGGHAHKMPRTKFSAEYVRQAGNRHLGCFLQVMRINVFYRRRKQHVHAQGLQLLRIVLQGARIAFEISTRRKLHWVNEYAHAHFITTGLGLLDQLQMTFVQIAHGGNKRQTLLTGFPLVNLGS